MVDWTRFEHDQGYCGRCTSQVIVKRRTVRHGPHLLMTLLTVGLWLPRWWRAAHRPAEPWRCCRCDQVVYRLMSRL